jgi:hypothetical protein
MNLKNAKTGSLVVIGALLIFALLLVASYFVYMTLADMDKKGVLIEVVLTALVIIVAVVLIVVFYKPVGTALKWILTKAPRELFKKDSKWSHWFYYTLSAVGFVAVLYYSSSGYFWSTAFPLLIFSFACATMGRNHHDAQKFITTDDLDGFWKFRGNWKKWSIYFVYAGLILVWIAVMQGRHAVETNVIR